MRFGAENAERELCRDIWKIAEVRQKWDVLSRQRSIAGVQGREATWFIGRWRPAGRAKPLFKAAGLGSDRRHTARFDANRTTGGHGHYRAILFLLLPAAQAARAASRRPCHGTSPTLWGTHARDSQDVG